jgi:hypothetical protein
MILIFTMYGGHLGAGSIISIICISLKNRNWFFTASVTFFKIFTSSLFSSMQRFNFFTVYWKNVDSSFDLGIWLKLQS